MAFRLYMTVHGVKGARCVGGPVLKSCEATVDSRQGPTGGSGTRSAQPEPRCGFCAAIGLDPLPYFGHSTPVVEGTHDVRLRPPRASAEFPAGATDPMATPRAHEGCRARGSARAAGCPALHARGMSGERPATAKREASISLPRSHFAKPTSSGPPGESMVFAGSFYEALLRTRTADPFLTMEVLYQLS